jgi:hypothetical protein
MLHIRNFLYHVLAFRALFLIMTNKIDYSKYECPYSHLEKECGHELHSPEGYQDVYSVWCICGVRAPVFYLDPEILGLKLKSTANVVDGVS